MPALSLSQLLSQVIFWQTPAALEVIPPDLATMGGILWQGGRAADALLLAEDWQSSSPLPLIFAAQVPNLPQGGTDFPPLLSLDYQPSLTADLARWLTHEARTMGIPVLMLPPAPAWSRDRERAQEMIHLWQHSSPDQGVLLAEEVLILGDPSEISPQNLAQHLCQGVKAIVTGDPPQVLADLTAAVQQGWLSPEQIHALSCFWLTLKKKLFPQAPLLADLADLPGDPIPPLQPLLGDTPLPQPWIKVSSPRHPWQQWRAPEALALAAQLTLGALETRHFTQPLCPDFTWIWTASLPTLTTPALAIPIAQDIPYLISHPWRDPHDITTCRGSQILLQWFGEMTPPPLFWHWLAENPQRLCGIILYGHQQDHPDLLHLSQTHAIPYARTLSPAPIIQESLLHIWLGKS